jgi:ribosomal protein S18 acetylase RimI-like enzyme
MIEIVELNTLTDAQVQEVIGLMGELDPTITVTTEMVKRTVEAPGTHFIAVTAEEHIIGCASLCVFESPTGRKASVEDVVVSSPYRGQHIGKQLMQYIIEYAKTLAPINLQLTSRPERVAANKLYQSLGFQKRGTNAYRMEILD